MSDDRLNQPVPAPSSLFTFQLERVARLELASSAWKAEVLPLNYTRVSLARALFPTCHPVPGPNRAPGTLCLSFRAPETSGGGGWIRTTEACASDLQSDPFGHSGTPPKSGGRFCPRPYPMSIDFPAPAPAYNPMIHRVILHSIAPLKAPGQPRIRSPKSTPDGRSHPCRVELSDQFGTSGAATKSRTRDLLITNQLLYQLSYSGEKGADSMGWVGGLQ